MARKRYLKKTPLRDARELFLARSDSSRVPIENVAVDEALDRITAHPVFAKISSPHYHAAAMDGIDSGMLTVAFFARRTVITGRSRPMVLELPSYKMPSLRSAAITAWDQGLTFLRKAGTVIVAICVVMWWLSTYPVAGPAPAAEALRAQAAAAAPAQAEVLLAEAEGLDARHAQAESFAGRIGRTVQPVFAPLGYDWQLTVGVLTSFLAREVFVSTMSVLLTGDAEGDVESAGVIERIRTAERSDGSPLFTPATAASLLVFFVLAMQCLPTLAVTRREAGGWKWAALQLGYMTGLAYVAALVMYHGLHLLGVA